jgi:hypothetical protein
MICEKHLINSANFKESYSMKFAYFVDGFILVIKRFNFHFLWSVRSGNSAVLSLYKQSSETGILAMGIVLFISSP